MKHPHWGFRITRCSLPTNATQVPPTIPGIQIEHKFDIADTNDNESDNSILLDCPMSNANLIESDDISVEKCIYLCRLCRQTTGLLYTGLTSTFPFMSLEENLCFLIVYHYNLNAILALPIANFTNEIILTTHKQQFKS